ncbi:TPA: hypothetical protein DCZ39_07595 [Patescibacteria group bacterium]|nr:hypothetical protein [Candidatus Gracilibacteria bacterium]
MDNAPNKSTPIISHTLPTNSPTPDIVPSSFGFVQSEIYAEMTGRINDNHKEIPKVMIITFRKDSLYPIKRYRKDIKSNTKNRNFLLLFFPERSPIKISITYGSLITANIIAT